MADSKGKAKRTFISLSSSSSSSSGGDELETEEDEDADFEDSSFSVSCYSGDETEEEEVKDSNDNDESLYNRVIALLKEGGELESLSLKHCKAYLRNHGLRITGTKAVCQQRILQHWKIKDGNAEALFPRSSFFIDCTGDVCKGDVVLFTQKVYQKFDKVTRNGKLLGRRTVAGRVVKESYGKAKQQHTFTVEVLWSKGIKKLPPLYPLLVKGRNLYKLKTYRQRWSDEAERRNVLDEKHKRGKAARQVRAMREARKKLTTDAGPKLPKRLHHSRPSTKRKVTEQEKKNTANAQRKVSIPSCANMSSNKLVSSLVREVKNIHLTEDIGATRHPFAGIPVLNPYQSQTNSEHWNAPLPLAGYDMESTSTTIRSLPSRPYADAWTLPAPEFSRYKYTHRANWNPEFYHK